MRWKSEWSLTDLTCDLSVLQTLQPTLRKAPGRSRWPCTAGKQIIAVWPGLHELAFGLAVDIGSTTIAAHLCDLSSGEVVASAGLMNPQIRFGEDLMSRVSYSMMNPGGAAQMTVSGARSAVHDSRGGGARGAAFRIEDILEATLVGNPDHASSAARHRSGGTRRRAVRARHRSLAHPAGERHRFQIEPQCTGLRAALHRGTRRRGCGGHGARRAPGSRRGR